MVDRDLKHGNIKKDLLYSGVHKLEVRGARLENGV